MYTIEHKQDHAIVTDSDAPCVRYIVMQDNDTPSPIEGVSPSVTAHCVASGYGSATESDDDLTRAFVRFADVFDDHHAFEVFQRYLNIFHGWSADKIGERTELHEHTGYSQGDWARVLFIVHDEGYGTAASWAREWSQWAQGDVCYVKAERFVSCDSPECHGDEGSHWSDVNDQGIYFEGLGGIFADDAEGAVKHYLEFAA